uniref:G protein pathway suppressor 2 n=1 Tax=Clastoptera arizonana TaxID=38151 RepID=A0A1B6DB60_9HEMI
MPAVIIGRPPQKNEAIYSALKTHIIRERQKKKQEQEADAENERQRKERERQQKQDVMTLGETREQISQLEQKLGQLKDEKHQLFLQLKKVLNEDDNRRRQLVKESNEVMEMYAYPGVSLGNPQIFLQQNIPIAGRNTLYKVPAQHTLLPGGTLKRRRSPSPPNASGYHSQYTYKPGAAPSAYQKVDDNRRAPEYFRAVLWNKNSQYGPYFPAPATTMQVSTGKSQAIYTYPGQHYTQPTGSSSTQQRESNNQESPVPPPKSLYMPQARQHSSQRKFFQNYIITYYFYK